MEQCGSCWQTLIPVLGAGGSLTWYVYNDNNNDVVENLLS